MSIELARQLSNLTQIKWVSRHDILPPNDYDYPVLIQFNDGKLALSNGGTVNDDKNISLWKDIPQINY